MVHSAPWKELDRFLDISALPDASVVLLALEHQDSLDDQILQSLFPWSDSDLTRMAKFRHQGARTSWCLSRLLYRRALASASGLDAHELPIGTGPFGKPFLAGSKLCFNLAHSSGCALLGVSRGIELGVDLEDSRRPSHGYMDIVEGFFLKNEQSWIQDAATSELRWERFLAMFVEKEARLKAAGTGLGQPLSSVEGSMKDLPFQQPGLACFRLGRQERYVAAVCIPQNTSTQVELRECWHG